MKNPQITQISQIYLTEYTPEQILYRIGAEKDCPAQLAVGVAAN